MVTNTFVELIKFCSAYSHSYIGLTELGYPIPLIKKGKGNAPPILLIGAVHAREHITSSLLSQLFELYNADYPLHVIPMLNIDGVMLAKGELDKSKDYSLWKANINGVDINTNFDANWGTGSANIRYPNSQNYIGEYPNSTKEAQTIVELLGASPYAMVVCYHSLGEEIYYGFDGNNDSLPYALQLAKFLGYKAIATPNSAGGIKDYYIQHYNGIGLTIEVGSDSYTHPYPISQLPNLLSTHKGSLELMAEMVISI